MIPPFHAHAQRFDARVHKEKPLRWFDLIVATLCSELFTSKATQFSNIILFLNNKI